MLIATGTVFKWLARALVVAGLAAVVVAVIGYSMLRTSLPAADGRASIAGLADVARIARDKNGVPHIEAKSFDDAARALGFAHAQDRLWQMHVLRMVAQGRLSEMFGAATVDTDIFLRSMDLAGASRRSLEVLSEPARRHIEAYAEGVNAWLNRDTGFLETRLPPEFVILRTGAEPWEPWQSVAILKVMALTLDSNMSREIDRLALVRRGFSQREIDEMLPYGPRDDPPPLPDLAAILELGGGSALTEPQREGAVPRLKWEMGVPASNNWVVSGKRTQSGKPLLANDPHLGLTTPTIFYLAHMAFTEKGERRQLVGATLPGTPFVPAGRSDRMAWGPTTTNLDSQDVFIERLRGDDPNQYLAPEGWRSFETEPVSIKVSGGSNVTFVRKVSRHGPVLPDSFRGIGSLIPGGHVAAVQWVALADDDTSADSVVALALARSADEFLAASTWAVAPMQSFAFADAEGNIGLIAPGRVPVRDPANRVAGRMPVPGWKAEYDWTGWMAKSRTPRILNPDTGALATANANWLPEGYDGHITFDWDENFRQARVEALVIGAQEKHSPDSMRRIQLDDYSPALAEFHREALAQLQAGSGQDPELMDALRDWDGRMAADSPLPLIMTAWWRNFEIALFKDDLGDDFQRFSQGHLQPVLDAITGASARDWCDNRDTQRRESCGITLAQALAAAIEELRASEGGDWRAWRWGKAHRALGEHRPFSSVGVLAGLFSVRPESGGGSYTLMRGRTDFGEDQPYLNRHASAYRAWYDLSDLDRSEYVTSTGQSGHFLSPHYGDLADDWAERTYIRILTNPAEYEEGIEGVWTLDPAAEEARK